MNEKLQASDEYLGAFIDGELDAGERERALAALEADSQLAQRACELRRVKDLVRHAYADVRAPGGKRRPPWARAALAARAAVGGALIVAGVLLGWGLNDLTRHVSDGRQATVPTGNVVIHVSSGDIDSMRAALDQAERLASSTTDSPPRVEVLANSSGIDLFVRGASPFAERIERIRREHPNVVFLACGQTLDNLQRRHVKVVLLPDVKVVSSALDQVLLRLREGWRYSKA